MNTIMMMDFSFRLICELSQYMSLTIKRAFFGIGGFQLTVERGMPGWEQLEANRLFYLPERPGLMLLAEKVNINRKTVTVSGVQLKGICKRRICVPPVKTEDESGYKAFGWDRFTGDAESAFFHFVENNVTAPGDGKRKMPGFVLAENLHRGEVLPWQARFDRLQDVLEDIGTATGLGWDILPDFSRKQFVFTAVEGKDLTQGSRRATLSREMGNVEDGTVTIDLSRKKGTIYAGGSGEDEKRMILSVGNAAEGIHRFEGWTDISGAEDAELLKMGAERKLEGEKRTLQVLVTDSGLCKYGRDYDLGDILRVKMDGYEMDARLIEMEESMENGLRTLKATFGDAPVTLTGILKTREKGSAK
ncbi:MAG: hypothetical protein E7331_04210 [Clostridiales bacterium]|nr:hypothetical protein [Clostridiales bacterium]